MKIRVTILTMVLALFVGFTYAANAHQTDVVKAQQKMIVNLSDLNTDAIGIFDINILEEDASCTVTVTVDILGNGATISATAETCEQAIQMVKKGIESLL